MKRLIDKLHQEQMLTAEEFHRLLANRSEETDQYARELANQVRNAERVYYDNKREWNKMVDRAMAADFSWSHSAKQYEEMYNWLIGDK